MCPEDKFPDFDLQRKCVSLEERDAPESSSKDGNGDDSMAKDIASQDPKTHWTRNTQDGEMSNYSGLNCNDREIIEKTSIGY